MIYTCLGKEIHTIPVQIKNSKGSHIRYSIPGTQQSQLFNSVSQIIPLASKLKLFEIIEFDKARSSRVGALIQIVLGLLVYHLPWKKMG